jgi:hypothetical protein
MYESALRRLHYGADSLAGNQIRIDASLTNAR